MMNKLDVIYCSAGREPVLMEIEDTLSSLQSLVGGYIEHVALPHDLHLWCNEEGRLLGLPVNYLVNDYPICGNFFICRADGPDLASVQSGDVSLVNAFVRPLL